MGTYLQQAQDFLILLQGTILLLAAAQAGLLRRFDSERGWGLLGLCGALLAAGEALDLLQRVSSTGLVFLAFLRAAVWLSALIVASLWFLPRLPKGVLSERRRGWAWSLTGWVLLLLGLSYTLRFLLEANELWFGEWQVLGRLLQIQVALVLLALMALRHARFCREQMERVAYLAMLRWRWIWTAVALVILVAGAVVAHFQAESRDQRMREEILNRTRVAASLISRELVSQLDWRSSDLERPAYEQLKRQMIQLVKANPDFRFAMLMGIEENGVRFLVDSEPPDSEDYSPPGQSYDEADAEYLQIVRRQVPFVFGPLQDRWGVWVSSSVPLFGSESPRGWVTIDFDVAAGDWFKEVGRARLPALLLTFLMLGALAGLVLAFEQVRTSAALAGMSERRSRTIVEGSRNCVMMLDVEGRFLVINQNGQDVLGRSAEELSGVSLVAIWPPRSRRAVMGMVTDTLKGGRCQTEVEYERPDGHSLVLSLVTSPIQEEGGRLGGFVCIGVDVTERRRVELELRSAKEDAEAAMRAKGEFLAVMSHEIRTPLSGVISLLGLLQKQPLPAQERRYADLARDNAETLLQILDDLLDAAKIEAGKLSMEAVPFSVPRTMSPVIEVMRVRAEAKGLAMTWDLSPEIPRVLLGDPTRLRQVVANLLSNAVKFTQKGSVHLSIRSDPVPPEWVMLHIRVSDTGEGIPREAQHKLFSKFQQADTTTTRRYGGTGLGLSIVKSIAEMMGGSIIMESEEGHGSQFTFSALLAVGHGNPETEAERSPEQAPQERPSDYCLRFLYAEDNETNQFILQSHLMLLGHDLEFAGDGREALEKLRKNRYDAVFMDCRMPVMDGFAATRELRNMKSGVLDPEIYVVALTANATEADRDRSLAAGMNDYLTKPVHEGDLRRAIDRIIAYQHRRGAVLSPRSEAGAGLGAVPGLSAAELLAMAGVEGAEEAPKGGAGLSNATLRTITRQYINDTPRRLQVMREALERGDGETLGLTAHSLKSVSRYVNALQVAEHCAKLETLADAGQLEAAKALLKLVEQGLQAELPRLEVEAAD